MRHWFIFLFLVTIVNPYEGIDYDAINVYDLENDSTYSIKVYGPEDNKNETSYTHEETARFIKKIDSIINSDFSPYVFED